MKNKQRAYSLITRIIIIIAFLLVWEVIVKKGYVPIFYTSCPSEIAKDLVQFYQSGDLAKHASITLQEAFKGLLYGSFMGISVGIFFGQFPFINNVFRPIISAISGIPQLTLAPVYILWFGVGLQSKIFLAALMAFFHVFFQTLDGIQGIEQNLIESANLLGANKLQILWKVVLPTCTPWIISGIRSGVGASLIGAIVGEYMGASAGFGWMVAYATSYFNIKRVMSCIFILLLVGMFLNYALDRIEKFLLKWRPQTSLNIEINNNYRD